jgi:hypothetical protein
MAERLGTLRERIGDIAAAAASEGLLPALRAPRMGPCEVWTYGWNEIALLPLKLAWCRRNGLRLCYVDNDSTDGSLEWARASCVHVGSVHTGGSFHLGKILDRMNEIWLERCRSGARPSWVLLLGVDLFVQGSVPGPFRRTLWQAHRQGAAKITTRFANACYTGEVRTGRLDDFEYLSCSGSQSSTRSTHTMIIRTDLAETPYPIFAVDSLRPHGAAEFAGEVFMFNFGHTKTAAERNATFQRRQKAWQEGLPAGQGRHYALGAKLNWTWRKEDLEHYRSADGFGPAYARLLDGLYPDRRH